MYLRRTYISGGGSRASHKISLELFDQTYSELSEEQKTFVDDVQTQERVWRNDHLSNAVFAAACLKFYDSETSMADCGDPITTICSECRAVYHLHAFKTALHAAENRPETVNYKHINKKYRSETLGHLFARSQGLEALVLSQVRNRS